MYHKMTLLAGCQSCEHNSDYKMGPLILKFSGRSRGGAQGARLPLMLGGKRRND